MKTTLKTVKYIACSLLVAVLGSLWLMPDDSKVVCFNERCASYSFLASEELDSSLVQTLDIEIKVSGNQNDKAPSSFVDSKKSIGLSWQDQERMMITIPMRHGATVSFDYLSPSDVRVRDLNIRILDSKSVYVFINGQIAYSHRYENAPFFVNNENLINTPKVSGNVKYTYKVLRQEIREKPNPFIRLGSIGLFIIFFAIVTFRLLRKVSFGIPTDDRAVQKSISPIIGIVGFSWIITLFAWFRNPIDATGAVNPGPFGPIGAAFSDFYQLSQLSQFDRPYDLGGTNYPPLGILILRLISFYDPNNLSFFPMAGVMLGTVYFLFAYPPNKRIVSLLFLTSFPFVFGVIRGNLDLLAIFLVWISVLSWKKEKYVYAAAAMAVAIALKIWPIVFLLLFLKKKNRLLFINTALLALFLTISASFILGYRNLFEVLNISSSILFDQSSLGTYAFQNTFSFSSLLFIGHIALMARNPLNISPFEVDNSLIFVNGIYSSMIIFSLLGSLIYFFFKAKHVANEFLILSGIVLLIPTQSFTYRALIVLLYFYLRNDVELVSDKNRSRNPAKTLSKRYIQHISLEKIRIWSTVPLFAPTAFYFIPGTQFSTASLFQPLGLLVFIGLAIYEERKSLPKIE
jgi:hypothetical protein